MDEEMEREIWGMNRTLNYVLGAIFLSFAGVLAVVAYVSYELVKTWR